MRHPGFPIAEVHADGSCVIHQTPRDWRRGHCGHCDGPAALRDRWPTLPRPGCGQPLRQHRTWRATATDRVRVTGARGEPPPPTLKVCCNTLSGYRKSLVFVLCGTDIEAKAALVRDQMTVRLAAEPPQQVRWTLARTDHPDADDEEAASALLHCTVRDPDPAIAGRAFSARAVEIGLGSYPGFHLTAPPGDASPVGVYHAGVRRPQMRSITSRCSTTDRASRSRRRRRPARRRPTPDDAGVDLPPPIAGARPHPPRPARHDHRRAQR